MVGLDSLDQGVGRSMIVAQPRVAVLGHVLMYLGAVEGKIAT